MPELSPQDKPVAVAAETLYLINLMLLPGLGFVVLFVLYLATQSKASALTRNHLSQTLGVSVVGAVLIAIVIALLLLVGGLDSPYTWVWIVFYFTFVHSSLIIMGVFGFIKALNNEHFVYPVLGRWFSK